jgi:hypothetical protein
MKTAVHSRSISFVEAFGLGFLLALVIGYALF